jgi:hypothetical protein
MSLSILRRATRKCQTRAQYNLSNRGFSPGRRRLAMEMLARVTDRTRHLRLLAVISLAIALFAATAGSAATVTDLGLAGTNGNGGFDGNPGQDGTDGSAGGGAVATTVTPGESSNTATARGGAGGRGGSGGQGNGGSAGGMGLMAQPAAMPQRARPRVWALRALSRTRPPVEAMVAVAEMAEMAVPPVLAADRRWQEMRRPALRLQTRRRIL